MTERKKTTFVNPPPTLRQDLFQEKKGIHIKLDKEVHSALRTLAFQRGITMQDVFEEFAVLLTSENRKAVSILDSFIIRKLNLPKRKKQYSKTRKRETEMSDLDKQSLYELIDKIGGDLEVGELFDE